MSIGKILLILCVFIVIAIIGIGVYFYYTIYKPLNKPNEPASIDIADEINKANEAAVDSTDIAESNKNVEVLVDRNINGFGPLTYPDTFNLTVFAEGLGKARALKFDPNGNLLVSITDAGSILALNDINNDGKAEIKTLIIDLNLPHGIAVNCEDIISKGPCDLYIAETNRVSLYAYDPEAINAVFVRRLFTLPADGYNNHFTRTLEIFEYDGDPMLFTTVGSSCNVCSENSAQRAAVLISNLNGSGLRVFSSGLRNAVFLEQRPDTEEIWVTEMGRDQLGDDIPPEEINVLQDGGFYGWPFCYDDKIHDRSFDSSNEASDKCANSIAPKAKMQAHSAPLGLEFVPGSWPEIYRNNLLVAFHGSWNRTEPTGYKIVRILLDKSGDYKGQEDFITGWLADNGEVLGRPVDIESNETDMYISDDKAGVIYKLSLK